MVTDTIGDFLTRIRNANQRNYKNVEVPSNRIVTSIADILKKEGYIQDYKVESGEKSNTINIQLVEDTGIKKLQKLIRVSKPGRRIYVGYREIPRVLSGLGISILSSSKGIITGKEAKKLKVGGEYICKIW